MAVDVVSEDEESWSLMSGSESSTASDTPEDEGQLLLVSFVLFA